MNLCVLFGQRKERYPGQYAPEAIACIDEYGNGDNPDYMEEQREKAIGSGDFASVIVVTLRVDGEKIAEALRPKAIVMDAEIADVEDGQ